MESGYVKQPRKISVRKEQLTKDLKERRNMGASWGGGGGSIPGRWMSKLEDAKGEKMRSVGHEIHTAQDM